MSGKLLALIAIIYVIGFILGASYEGTWALDSNGANMPAGQKPVDTIGYLFNIGNAIQHNTVLGIIPLPVPNGQYFLAWFRALTFQWSFLVDPINSLNFQLVWWVFFLPFSLLGILSMVTIFMGILRGNITW